MLPGVIPKAIVAIGPAATAASPATVLHRKGKTEVDLLIKPLAGVRSPRTFTSARARFPADVKIR